MSKAALARKWRPHRFDEIAGQQHIVQTLYNALEQQRLHHAYLFTGTRGVGKTTIARIIAKCLNCERGITPTPCGECNHCQEIDAGRFIDLLEVDAASRTKVEDTRELLDNVQYAPSKGRFKVYLIDEVHMLSGHSFNALLKTLEEPPTHVKFLLATTEPQKLPKTVRSRCLQFHLHAIEPEIIQAHLQKILTAEAITFDETALRLLSIAAEGSVRDSLSLLDQAIAYGGGQVPLDSTQKMLGYLDSEHLFNLLSALGNQDANTALGLIPELTSIGADFLTLCKQLLNILQQIAVLQVLPEAETQEPNREKLIRLCQALSPEQIQLYYQIILHGQRDIELAASQRSGFEMLIIRLLCFAPNQQTPLQTTKIQSVTSNPAIKAPAAQHPDQTVKNTDKSNTNDNWLNIIPQLKLTGASQMLVKYCTMRRIRKDKLEIAVAEQQKLMANERNKDKINSALRELFGNDLEIDWVLNTGESQTPQQHEEQSKAEKQAQAEQNIEQDAQVQQILQTFDATIVAETVKATDEDDSHS